MSETKNGAPKPPDQEMGKILELPVSETSGRELTAEEQVRVIKMIQRLDQEIFRLDEELGLILESLKEQKSKAKEPKAYKERFGMRFLRKLVDQTDWRQGHNLPPKEKLARYKFSGEEIEEIRGAQKIIEKQLVKLEKERDDLEKRLDASEQARVRKERQELAQTREDVALASGKKHLASMPKEQIAEAVQTSHVGAQAVMEYESLSDENEIAISFRDGEETRERRINLESTRQTFLDFYQQRQLPEYSQALSSGQIRMSPEARQRAEWALSKGLNRVAFLPPEAVQNDVGIARLKTSLADTPVSDQRISQGDQYTASFLNDTVRNQSFTEPKEVTKRRTAYMVFYSDDPLPPETMNMTYEQAEKWMEASGYDGLTLGDYYVAQNFEFTQNANHNFDRWVPNSAQSRWGWMLGTRVPSGCAAAGWDPGDARVEVDCWDSGDRDPGLGARPAVVVPIEFDV